jgi:hypothetical protein
MNITAESLYIKHSHYPLFANKINKLMFRSMIHVDDVLCSYFLLLCFSGRFVFCWVSESWKALPVSGHVDNDLFVWKSSVQSVVHMCVCRARDMCCANAINTPPRCASGGDSRDVNWWREHYTATISSLPRPDSLPCCAMCIRQFRFVPVFYGTVKMSIGEIISGIIWAKKKRRNVRSL